MRLLRLAGLLLSLGLEVKTDIEDRTISSDEAKRIIDKLMAILIEAGVALTANEKKVIAAALREAADDLDTAPPVEPPSA